MSLGKDAEDKEGPEEIRGGGEGTCLLKICMLQREGSIVTGFKDSDRIEGISEVSNGMKVHCNTGEVVSNKVGSWGKLKAWHLPDFIANIISMNMNASLSSTIASPTAVGMGTTSSIPSTDRCIS